MHILLAILGIAAAGAFWWYRLKMMNDAAGEAIDTVGRVRGNFRRKKIRKQNELSPVTAISDPVVGAATIITALVTDDLALSSPRDTTLRKEIGGIASNEANASEALIYAKWASEQIDDAATVIDKVSPLLREKLDDDEKLAFLDMVRRVATADPDPIPTLEPNLRRLRQKLGLVIN